MNETSTLTRRDLATIGTLALAYVAAIFDSGPGEGMVPLAAVTTLLLAGLGASVWAHRAGEAVSWFVSKNSLGAGVACASGGRRGRYSGLLWQEIWL